MSEAAERLGIAVGSAPVRVLQARAAIGVFLAWKQSGLAALGAELARLLMQATSMLAVSRGNW